MSTTSQLHALPTQTKRERDRTRRVHSSPRSRRRSQVAPEQPIVIAVMGPANHAPGVPIMGAPSRSVHPVMGGPDAGPRVSVMGAGDQGTRIDLFGNSDPMCVDLLFAPMSTAADAAAW